MLFLDNVRKKIVWSFNLKISEVQQLEKLLLKLPKGKYEPLTMTQANQIVMKSLSNNEEEVCFFNFYIIIYCDNCDLYTSQKHFQY